MATLKIYDYLTEPKPLRRHARPVRDEEFNTDAFQTFCRDLTDTMMAHKGRGLASTQVDAAAPDGQAWRVFSLYDPETGIIRVICNPEIFDRGGMIWDTEGCLSFRTVGWLLRAPSSLVLKGFDAVGEPLDFGANGIDARAIAHEAEHLDGKLMLDRIPMGERQKFLARVAKVKRP